MLTGHDVLRFSCPVYRILYRFLAALAGLAVRSGRSNDLEIIVLRHQLTVLCRQDNRPQLNHNDRSLLGAIAAALPRRRRLGWSVTPDTVLGWYTRHTARHWTQPTPGPTRPSTTAEVRRLVIDMATDNPTRRHSPAAPLLLAVLHRRHQPRSPLRRYHRQSHRSLDVMPMDLVDSSAAVTG